MYRSGLGVGLVCLLGLLACGSSDTGDSSGTGGTTASTSTGTATSGTGGGGAGPCNELALPPVVTKTADPAALPAFTGGVIADGTYAVTSIVTYGTTTPGGTTVQEVYELIGGAARTAVASSEMAEVHYAGTYTTAGNVLTYAVTCPITAMVPLQYTATPTTLAFQHGSDPNEVAYATKQ
jgi:hypothetical protein